MTKAAAALATLALAGCGGGDELPRSWVGSTPTYAAHVSWDRSGERLKGSAVGTGIGCDDSDPPQCSVQDEERFDVRGTIADRTIRLRFALGTRVHMTTGTISPSELILQDEEGGAPLRLRPGSRSDYEEAVAALDEGAVEGEP